MDEQDSPPPFTQDERPRSVAETSQYSGSNPDLALGPVINEYDSMEENAPSYLPISDSDNDDDPTPRPVENRAVSELLSLRSAETALSMFVDCALAAPRIVLMLLFSQIRLFGTLGVDLF